MDSHTQNLTVTYCNIQGGLNGISLSTEITKLIRRYDLDVLERVLTQVPLTFHRHSILFVKIEKTVLKEAVRY